MKSATTLRSILVLLVLVASKALLALPTAPQHETVFTLSFVDAPLKDVFAEIEKDSKFTFVYKDGINLDEKVSFASTNERIETLLPPLLKNQNLSFEIDGQQITIYKKESKPFREIIQTVKGTVTDEYGEPIISASILVKGSANGITSNTQGEFELPVDGTVTLIITFADKQKAEVLAYPGQNLKIILRETTPTNQ